MTKRPGTASDGPGHGTKEEALMQDETTSRSAAKFADESAAAAIVAKKKKSLRAMNAKIDADRSYYSALIGAMSMGKPTLDMIRAAYLADEIDSYDVEVLTEAALNNKAVKVPKAMLWRFDPPALAIRQNAHRDKPRYGFGLAYAALFFLALLWLAVVLGAIL